MTIFKTKNGFGGYTIFSNEIYGGDLDEMIDFQKIQSRDICHFQTDFNGIQ